MKELVTVLSFLVFLGLFCSCQREEPTEQNQTKNPLVGTIWKASYNGDALVIEFTSENDFRNYTEDSNGNLKQFGLDYGNYSISGNRISFSNHTSTNRFDFAIVNGDIMELHYYYNPNFTRNYKKTR